MLPQCGRLSEWWETKLRRLIAAILFIVALVSPLAAQTRAQLTTTNDTYYYTNGTNAITGAGANTVTQALINGMGVLGDTNSWIGQNTFNGSTLFPGLTGCLQVAAGGLLTTTGLTCNTTSTNVPLGVGVAAILGQPAGASGGIAPLGQPLLVVPAQYSTIAAAQAVCPATGCTIEIQTGFTIAGATFTQGQNVKFDCGPITVSATIVFSTIKGGIYEGCGTNRNSTSGGTSLEWVGNSSTAMLSLQAVQFSTFRGFTIAVQSGTLNTGIEVPNVLVGTSTQDTFTNFIISGVAGNINYGMQIGNLVSGGPGTSQDDQMNIEKCLIENYTIAGISIEYAQSKYERITGCSINGDQYGGYGITTALNSSSGGSFVFRNGSMTQNTALDFYLGAVTDNITIDSSLFEGSTEFLSGSTSGSSMWPVTISNNRFTADGVGTGGVALDFTNEGPLVLINNVFGTGYTHGTNLTVNARRGSAVGVGNSFYNGSNPPYTGSALWQWYGTITGTGGSPVLVPSPFYGPVGAIAFPTAPTFTSGACVGAMGANPNGTSAFQVTTGTGSCGSTFTIGMPANQVSNTWVCYANDIADTGWIKQTADSTTAIVFTHETIGTVTPSNFTVSHTIDVKCSGD